MEKLTPLISRTEPWEHNKRKRTDTTPDPSSTSRVFDRRKQSWRVFTSGLWQATLTAAFCAVLFGVYVFYSRKPLLSDDEAKAYNAINIGLSLLLGAQIASSFKGFARNIRWQLLSSQYFDLNQFDMVLGCESMLTSTRLLWSGRAKGHKLPSQVQWYCAVSLILNLAMQVIVAILGLVVAPEISALWVGFSKLDRIGITDFSHVQFNAASAIAAFLPLNSSEETISNAYGYVGNYMIERIPDPTTKEIDGEQALFYGDLSSFYSYELYEQVSPQPGDWLTLICLIDYALEIKDREPSSVTSWRGVASNAECDSSKTAAFVTHSELLVYQGDVSNSSASIIWDGPRSRNLTTWATRDRVECGPRCTNVQALVPIARTDTTDELYDFYDCNSTVSEIWTLKPQAAVTYNSARGSQIPNATARMFAGAIGRLSKSSVDDMIFYSKPTEDRPFYVAPEDTSRGRLESSISTFATLSIGAMDNYGKHIEAAGFLLQSFQVLVVQWHWVILILAGLPLVQLVLVIVITILSTRVVIKDTSYIAAAQLLKPALEGLASQGSILTGDEITEHLGKHQLCYGVRDLGSGEYFVDVVRESEWSGDRDDGVWVPGRKMPEGHYDGPEAGQ